MPKSIKLQLKELKIQSFITHLNHIEKTRFKGKGDPKSFDIHRCDTITCDGQAGCGTENPPRKTPMCDR